MAAEVPSPEGQDSSDLIEQHSPPRVLRRRRRSRGWREQLGGVLILGICCGFLCCGVSAWVFRAEATREPQRIIAIANEITPIQLMKSCVPVEGDSAENFLFSTRRAVFALDKNRGTLVLTELALNFNNGDKGFKTALQQRLGEVRNLSAAHQTRAEKTYKVRGQDVVFQFTEGEDVSSRTRLQEVRAEFPGRRGTAIFLLQWEASIWDLEGLEAMLKSLE